MPNKTNQSINKMLQNMDLTPQQIASMVFETRRILLQKIQNQWFQDQMKENHIHEQLNDYIKTMPNLAPLNQLFLRDLIIATTRVWEAFTIDELGQFIFKEYGSRYSRVFQMLMIDFFRIEIAFNGNNPLVIIPIEANIRNDLLHIALQNISNHFELLKNICHAEYLSMDTLNDYFHQVQLYSFKQFGLVEVLLCLSSFDGKIIYVREDLLEPDQDTYPLIQVIEHECIDNLIRYGFKNQDPFYISQKKNGRLVTIDGHQIQAGDFYELIVYNQRIWNPSPFSLQSPQFAVVK